MSADTQDFASVLQERLADYGDRPFIEFDGRWHSGDDIRWYVSRVTEVVRGGGLTDDSSVSIVVRNRVPHAAVILGLVAAARSFSMVYAFQSAALMAADVERLGSAVVIADAQDWSAEMTEAARRAGSIGIALDLGHVGLVEGLERPGPGPVRVPPHPASVEVLTSGTTGPPKRVALAMNVLERGAITASAFQQTSADEPPDLVFWPFGGIGGVCQLAGALYAGKRMVLLEKFAVAEWVSAVRRHRIARVGVQPTVVRTLLESDVPPGDLASLQIVFGGSAALEPETQERFEQRFGVPVLWAYGATEFAGTLLAWTPDLYRRYKETKRGSVGRAVPGTEIRIVDPVSGESCGPGEQGYLEAHIPLIGPEWIRTTDLASVDADGFVTLHGRGDGAINRGGFKVLPEVVADALRAHPAVLDGAVVGLADARLGQVPAAVVELVPGAERPTADELKAHVRGRLPAHHVPVRVEVVERLPRTPSLKVSLPDVAALLGAPGT